METQTSESSIRSKGQPIKIPGWRFFTLWPHQRAALEMIEEYLGNYPGREPKAALVQMPTGTGKTGIAAVVSMCGQELPTVLILTPRTDLKKQMIEDIGTKYWTHIGVDPGVFSKKVLELRPSNAENRLAKIEDRGGVLVGSPQTLLAIEKKLPHIMAELKEKVSLVIFDEGHYEPAESWAKAVRHLEKPTILLSATPYRNDFRIFRVDPFYSYSYSFKEAVADRYLRGVEFEIISKKLTLRSFAKELVKYFNGKFRGLMPDSTLEPRVIVRCGSREEVEQTTAELRRLKQPAVGIHDAFTRKDNTRHCYKHFKDVDDPDAIFFVHQFKLMEGLDDERFCLLALYTPFGDDRSTVQQIGRILRNRSRGAWQTAYVFAFAETRASETWNRFLINDRAIYEAVRFVGSTHRGSMINMEPDFPRKLVESQPPTEYIDGHFSQRFDIHAEKAYECLSLPRTTRIYKVEEDLAPHLDDIKDEICGKWRSHNREPAAPHSPPDENSRVILFYSYRNSSLLQPEWYFMECKLGVTVFHWVRPFLFYYDSEGLVPDSLSQLEQRLTSQDLKKLLGSNGRTRLFLAALDNTNLGPKSMRSTRHRAYSLGAMVHGIADHNYICKKAFSFIEVDKKHDTWLRRDVGFKRKQVSETLAERMTFDEYTAWLDGLADLLGSPRIPDVKVLKRFAESCDPPPPDQARARHILLDLFGVEERFKNVRNPRQSLELEDSGARIAYSNRSNGEPGYFSYKINGRDYQFQVQYDPHKHRYRLEDKNHDLNLQFRHEYKEMGVLTYLNREQAFRIIPQSPGLAYAFGEFFRPVRCIPTATGHDEDKHVDMCSVFHGAPELVGVKSEKGEVCQSHGAGWQEDSLFNIIDEAAGNGYLGGMLKEIDTLVCDDMGTEVADFIAADCKGDGRVIFIHAKAFREPLRYTASKLAEVCSQAVKNLEFVDRFSNLLPPNLNRWSRRWRAPHVRGHVSRRIRTFKKSALPKPTEVWAHIREILQNPLARIEVWLVLGNGYSRQELQQLILSGNPPPELLQNIYQVESTWSLVAEMGAHLRIFCRP